MARRLAQSGAAARRFTQIDTMGAERWGRKRRQNDGWQKDVFKAERWAVTSLPNSGVGSEAFRQSHRFDHRLRFVHRLLVFAFGRGIIDPAAAGLYVSFAVFEQSGADRDATIEVPVEAEVTDASAVRSACGLLQVG